MESVVYIVMWFGLHSNTPSTFQRDMQEVFGSYLTEVMQIFLDDLGVFGLFIKHLEHLRSYFQCCRAAAQQAGRFVLALIQ